MNCCLHRRPETAFRTGVVLCVALLGLVVPSPAQTNRLTAQRPNLPAPERFLLIVETSAAMQKCATNVQGMVGYLFSSGLTGQLKLGDTLGVWTYNNELHTGEVPLLRWVPQASREIASKLAQFVQKHPYAKPSHLGPVMEQLTNVVADSDKLTVILISNGSEPLVGTPFDGQIAESFKLNAAEQQRKAMPFVTVLRAVKGKYVGVRVNTPPWPFELPAFPEAKVTPALPPTNPPPPKVESPPSSTPVKPVAVPEPLPVKVEATNPPPATTNLPVIPVAPPPVERPTNPSPAVVVTPKPVETNAPTAQVATTNPAPVSPTTTAAPVVSAERKRPLMPILIGAAIVLVGLAVLCLVILSRSRKAPRVSLITRSMNKDGK